MRAAPEPSSFPSEASGGATSQRDFLPPLRVRRRGGDGQDALFHAPHPSPPPGNAAGSSARSPAEVRGPTGGAGRRHSQRSLRDRPKERGSLSRTLSQKRLSAGTF